MSQLISSGYHAERSGYIFDLAERLGITLKLALEFSIDDATYVAFRDQYRIWAKERDKALKIHLSKGNMFRTYLPYKERVFQIAYQVLWYLDEIIVRDPIGVVFLNRTEGDYQAAKESLLETLRLLYAFRQSIDSGYLLLAGEDIIPRMQDNPPIEVLSYIQSKPELIAEIDRAVSFGMLKRPDRNGNEWTLYQAKLDFGAMVGWSIKELPPGENFSPAWKVGEAFPAVSAEELSKEIHREVPELFKEARQVYPRELYGVLYAASVAGALKSSVLFDRYLDSLILSSVSTQPLNSEKQASTIGAINLGLPYVSNIPPDRLLDLRNAMPEAFLEFRASMLEIISKAIKEHPDNADEWARSEIERRLASTKRAMESEMQSSLKKVMVQGGVGSLVLATGALIGNFIHIPSAAELGMVVSGTMAALNAVASYVQDRMRVGASNSFYFLWKAQQVQKGK